MNLLNIKVLSVYIGIFIAGYVTGEVDGIGWIFLLALAAGGVAVHRSVRARRSPELGS